MYSSFSSHDRARSPVTGQLKVPEKRSVHLSPDRITRHAQPSPKVVDTRPQEVVSRIPQPYRTSFSAVTAPRRQARQSQSPVNSPSSTSGDISPQPQHEFRRNGSSHFSSTRSKSASDSNVLDSDFTSAHDSIRSQCFFDGNQGNSAQNSNTKEVVSRPPQVTTYGSDTSLSVRTLPPQDHRTLSKTEQLQQRLEALQSKQRDNMHLSKEVCTEYKPSKEYANDNHTYEIVNRCPSPMESSTGVDSPEFSMFSEFTSDFNSSSTDKLYYADPSLIKDVIEKQYVHVTNVDYHECMNKNLADDEKEVTDKLVQGAIQSKRNVEARSHVQNSGSPTGEKPETGDKQNRSVSSSPASSRKKSISTSISNFFNRMSPKSLRKSPQTEKKKKSGSHSDTSSIGGSSDRLSLSSENSEKNSAKPPRGHKSPKLLPLKHIFGEQKRKDDGRLAQISKSNEEILNSPTSPETSCSSNVSNVQPLTNSGPKLLKPLNSKNSTDKSVYQTFKEKHSPYRANEANSNKSQALRATAPHSSTASPNSRQEDTPTGIKSREPPRTLDVRDVSKLSKNFQLYSFSTESIGQCSLDAYASKVGSEPSLVSANGQRSSDSKRTLHSGDPVSSSSLKHGTTDIPNRQQCKSDSTLDRPDNYGSSWCNSNSKETPNTPSYVRLSCSVSGYGNKYSSPDRELSRLTVIKKTSPPPQRNGTAPDETDSSRLLRQNSPLANGYLTESNGHVTKNGSPPIDDVIVHSSTELSQSKSGRKSYRTSIKVRPSSISASLSSGSLSSTECEKEQNESVVNNTSDVFCDPSQDSEAFSETTERVFHTVNHSNASHETTNLSVVDLEDSNTDSKQQNVVTEESLKLNLTAEEEPQVEKNGRYFLDVVQRTEDHLNACCDQVEKDLSDPTLSEEVSGKLRAAIGKANLLIKKKFKQFRGLCEQNINQTGDEQFITTGQDLAGFWDMVLIQVEDVDALFKEIEQLKANGWKETNSSVAAGGRLEKTHVRQSSSGSANIQLTPRGTAAGSKGKSPRGKENTGDSTSQSDRAAKAKEAAKAREEARKRLLAAKRAGRKRVASHSDNTEIEIYAPE